MDALQIHGGRPLVGTVHVSGAKNATLPIMAAALLAPGTSVLSRVPHLADVATLGHVLQHLGVNCRRQNDVLHLDATVLTGQEAPYAMVRTMRASILVLGPLLARCGRARVSLPGGCAIGARPVDQHLKGLVQLGAQITIEHGYIVAKAPNGLHAAEICFDVPTVTATENLMLAAAAIDGTTVLHNAACEPEIADLATVLVCMGARIDGAGTPSITIRGCTTPTPYTHRVIADRIECGTFLVAGALMGAPLIILDGTPAHQTALLTILRAAGADIAIEGPRMVVRQATRPTAVDVRTAPYPGLPTDMQAQLMALLCVAAGRSVITETIFENRFMHVAELDRLGANIRVDGRQAVVDGVAQLSGSTVMATDLRASACLVLAGLVACGTTLVRRVYHLDRGYEALEQKLAAAGACISRVHNA